MGKLTLLTAALLLAGIPFHAAAQSCLTAHYPFNGTANDTSGNNYHGLNNGAALTADRYGIDNKAYHFDAVSSRITLNNNAPVITSAEFTIAAWARMDGAPGGTSGQGTIFQQRDDDASIAAQSTILLMAENESGNTAFLVRSSVNTNGMYHEVIAARPAYGEWHHYVASLGADDTLRLYIDGAEVGKTLYTQTGDFVSSVDHVSIGNHAHTGSELKGLFNGDIDEVKIYSCALTPQDIDSIYTSVKQLAGEESNASAYPNPFSERAVITFHNPSNETHTLMLYDDQGRLVASMTNITSGRVVIDRNSLASGLYFFVLSSPEGPRSRGRLAVQ